MSSIISDAFTAHHVHLQDEQLDLNTIKELPDSHAWVPAEEQPPMEDSFEAESIPVIDLNDHNSIKNIQHACKTWGAFQVTNHWVPPSLLSDTEDAVRSLFALPMQQKLKAARSPDGISGYGLARISSFFSKLMWSEGFTIMGSPEDHARQLWPQDYKKFCDVIEEYEKEMKTLAGRLLWLILGSMGITREDVKWAGACGALQLNSYPACPNPNRAMGLAPHTDSTLLTILYQNKTKGLQVQRDGTQWVTVPPMAGALVVHLGDMLHIITNGLFPSVIHRAMVNRTQHRLSIAYLYGPPRSVKISPLPKLVTPNQPPLYRPITWTEYLGTKAQHFDKALSLVRACVPPKELVDSPDSIKV